jgi:choline kinase
VDLETLTVLYYASFTNAHCPVERSKPAAGIPTEPLKVFIKFYNDNGGTLEIFNSLVLTKREEVISCHEYGRAELEAKVFRFFKTLDSKLRRIDEFQDISNIEPEDIKHTAI